MYCCVCVFVTSTPDKEFPEVSGSDGVADPDSPDSHSPGSHGKRHFVYPL